MDDAGERHAGEYDYIIVGGGSAGCLLANRLSADPAVTVLLLEAGGGWHFWYGIPIGYRYTVGRSATDWMLETEPEPELDNRRIPFPRGIALGGSTLINGMIYTRGHRRDYDRWVQAGALGWSWDDVLAYFKRSERHHAGASASHGGEGEVHVERQRANWRFLDVIGAAAVEATVPWTTDFNCGEHEGVGWYEATQHSGRRWDAARAFVDPVRNRPNLRIIERALVERVLLSGRRADGVLFNREGETFRATARGEIIVAAGSILSPRILELSGIGNPQLLKDAGVEPAVELAGVGENLQDHLQVRMGYRLNGVSTLNQQLGSVVGKAIMASQYALFRSGPLSMAASQLGIFARSRPDKDIADLQYHVVPYSSDRVGGEPHPFPGVTMSVCQLDPESRGTVHIRSADPRAKPAIRANYLSAEEDRRVMVDAMRLTRRIMAAAALSRLSPEEILPAPDAQSREDLLSVVREHGTTIYHPVGTCRMGSDAGAVTDPSLRVRGVDGLRIADASVMPLVPSANTNAATMMIAEKAADLIREAGRRS